MAAYAGIVEHVSIGAIGVHRSSILAVVHGVAVGAGPCHLGFGGGDGPKNRYKEERYEKFLSSHALCSPVAKEEAGEVPSLPRL